MSWSLIGVKGLSFHLTNWRAQSKNDPLIFRPFLKVFRSSWQLLLNTFKNGQKIKGSFLLWALQLNLNCCFNLLCTNISMHILHTFLYTFPEVLTRRIYSTIKNLWSFPVFLWLYWVIQGDMVRRNYMLVTLTGQGV